MLIEEIINEKEFGLISRGKAAVANMARGVAGKLGSTKMHNKAIKGKVRQVAMKGANKVSDAYTKWLAAKYPEQDPNVLNSEQFKEFMKTSNLLKGQQAQGFPMFNGLPAVQKALKEPNPTVLDANTKAEVFMAIAMSQQVPGAQPGGGTSVVKALPGASTDPKDMQDAQGVLDKLSDAQKALVANMIIQQSLKK